MSSISGVSSNPAAAIHVASTATNTTAKPPQKLSPDGDTPAVEAAESAATRAAEKAGGGFNKKV
jgi:hypothetical protein